eukprot:comp6064_c0_seq1/m.1901 comp6064_c0_seq1/g.1901  ORF comp6064_c0_seq1/g.1901 comp6064_c0_seq1/m.1901 type:complete len:633 (-) comp6064_c0_seq1:531-2429(-)
MHLLAAASRSGRQRVVLATLSKPHLLVPSVAPITTLVGGYKRGYKEYDYDLVVIGAGAAGFAAAVRAWDMKKKVLLVEKKWLGGATLWDGALSSKCMWQLSRRTRGFRELLESTRSGLTYEGSYPETQRLVNDAQLVKSAQLEAQLEALQKGGFSTSLEQQFGGQVDLMIGHASFIDQNTISVACDGRPLVGVRKPNTLEVGFHHVSAKKFLIATGSRPREVPQWPVDGRRIINSDHIFGMKKIPESICIIGAGVIGCEFTAIFSNFGQTRVHLVNERRPRLLPTEDPDLSRFITKSYEDSGVKIHNMVKVINLETRENEVAVTLGDIVMENGEQKIIPREPFTVECVLLSVGRVANTRHLNMKAVGVEMKPGDAVKTNKHAQTNVPHIYAAGDATMDIGLVSVAEMEARHAVEHMFMDDPPEDPVSEEYPTPLSYDNVSSIMFLRPEVACVGMNELSARRAKLPHRVAFVGFDINNRGIINRPQYAREYLESPSSEDMSGPRSAARRLAAKETKMEHTGFVKMIVTADEEARLLGMRAAGEDASAIIQAAALLIVEKKSIRHLERLLHPHPAITESVQECARMVLGRSIHKPHVFASCWVRTFIPKKGEKPLVDTIGLVPSYGTEDKDFDV